MVLSITDQGSTYSGDLESEAVSTPHSWEDELNHYALRSNAMQDPDPELRQFSKGDMEQDLEADFPSGLCNMEKKNCHKYVHGFLNKHFLLSLLLSINLLKKAYISIQHKHLLKPQYICSIKDTPSL